MPIGPTTDDLRFSGGCAESPSHDTLETVTTSGAAGAAYPKTPKRPAAVSGPLRQNGEKKLEEAAVVFLCCCFTFLFPFTPIDPIFFKILTLCHSRL